MGFFGPLGLTSEAEKLKSITLSANKETANGGSVDAAQTKTHSVKINVVHEAPPKAEVEKAFGAVFPEKEFKSAIIKALDSKRSASTKKVVAEKMFAISKEDIANVVIQQIRESNQEINSLDQLEGVIRSFVCDPDTEFVLELQTENPQSLYNLSDSEKPKMGEIFRTFAARQEQPDMTVTTQVDAIATRRDDSAETTPETTEKAAVQAVADTTDNNPGFQDDKKEAKKTTLAGASKKIETKTDLLVKNIANADAQQIANLEEFLKDLARVKTDGLSEAEKTTFEGKLAYGAREIEKAWLARKYENKDSLDLEMKDARQKVGKIIRDILKFEIEKRGFANVEGGVVKSGEKFHVNSIYMMGTIVAKDFCEDETLLRKVVEAKWKGEEWKMSNVDQSKLAKIINDSFSNGQLDRAAYIAYQYRMVCEQISQNKKIIEAGRLQKGLPMEMESAEKKDLENRLMAHLGEHEDLRKKFVELRKQKPDAHINGITKKTIAKLIREFIAEEFFVEKSNDDIIKSESEMEVPVENVPVSDVPTPEEFKRERKFEFSEGQREKKEDLLLKAIDGIEEITADDLEVDAIPVDKHFVGNLKERIETLLNKSGYIDENPYSDEARSYWEELCELEPFANEVGALDREDKICVIYQGNTFFINRRREIGITPEQKLREIVGSEKRWEGLLFGLRNYYQNVTDKLKDELEWRAMSKDIQDGHLHEAVKLFMEKSLGKQDDDVVKAAFNIVRK